MKRLGDVMRAMRAQLFVGRSAELALFREALTAEALPFHVLHLWGPGGVGKTALTLAFREVCDDAGLAYYRMDGRDVGASPEAFEQAVRRTLGENTTDGAPRTLEQTAEAGRFVLVVDSYEALASLDRWLCESFLPQLPADALLVLAGRYERSAMWRTWLGLPDLVHPLPLRNLTDAESRAYLDERALPAEHHADALAFAHGYPLALSLIADAYDQNESAPSPSQSPDVVGTLLKRFLDEGALTPEKRRAVEASALARYVTQPLLAALTDIDTDPDADTETRPADAATLFMWLRGLSFVEADAQGLRMHDLAREVLAADLRWRDAARYDALETTLRHYYTACLTQAHAGDFEQVLVDYLFLVRENPIVKPFYDELLAKRRGARPASATTLTDDLTVLRAGVARHEGEASAAAFAAWVQHHPDGLCVFRGNQGQAIGLLYAVPLSPEDHTAGLPNTDLADPGIDAARAFLRQHAPLRSGESGLLFRWWLSLEDYQDVSLVQGTIFVETVKQYMRTPDLAYSLLPCAAPDMWAPVFGYADLSREDAADFTLDGHVYGAFGHDWRVRPASVWLDLMAARGSAFRPAPTAPAQRSDLVVLNESDFADALKDALLHFTQPDRLRPNLLLRSRLVHDPTYTRDAERIEALRTIMQDAVATLRRGPREAKFARALNATYLDPAPTQERAAERLGLPFSTYRRHLRQGLDALTHALWQREVRG